MLERLIINNIAIIKDIDVKFNKGLNIISGDTGAGKSLIIDSLLLLSGNRAYQNLIRYGEKSAFVEAYFTSQSPKLEEYLISIGITDTKNIVIRRELKDSRNIIKLNNKNITLTELKDIASYLFNIHEQQDTFKLYNEANYLDFLDNEDNIIKAKNDYLLTYINYQEVLKKYKDLLNNKNSSTEKLDFLLYEQKELSELDLKENEDELLKEEISVLKNYNKIFTSLKDSYELLDNYICDNLYKAKDSISSISNLKDKYSNIDNNLADIYYNLEDIKSSIYNELNSLDYDELYLENLENRYYEIEKIKDKYKKSVSELISYYNNISYEIDKIVNYDDLINKVKNELLNIEDILKKKALKIRDLRINKAKSLEKEIIKTCQDLDLANISFKIEFNSIDDKSEYKEEGIDTINFLVSFNIGEPLKELAKVASGGELARFMLAIKTIEAKTKNYSLMVFDEIDTGVSGEAALKIAKKIKEISSFNQVICITHIASVAASGDTSYLIYKEESNGKTYAYIKELNIDERIEIIARMIAGNNLSKGAIMNAKELLHLL